MKENLIPIAYDADKNIVFARDAIKEKGKKYFCPECGKELIYKNSGKTGPKTRRPHFAHKGDGEHNCSPESVLHSVFKEKTAEILKQKIENKEPFIVEWICKECNQTQKGNLLFFAKRVEVEYDMDVCRPDVALLDEKGKVLFAIEIVNTHAPEDKVLDYYKENGIILVRYNVVEDDLKDINDKLLRPDEVSFCENPQCKEYSSHQNKDEIFTVSRQCKKCHRTVIIFFIRTISIFGFYQIRGVRVSEFKIIHYIYRIDRRNLIRYNFNNYGNEIQTYGTRCLCTPIPTLLIPPPKKRNNHW